MELDFRAIGQRIKIARIKKHLTQDTVSKMVNITPSHMSNVETGKSTVSLPTLVSIANALGVSVDELLCDTILDSKVVFEKELSDILKDCNDYEIRVLVDILKASKESIRNVKIFQNKLENRY
ncbi:TPA: helix-turn-helix transcriptional regulator [Clostridioides difficile]|uniref:helix-turn-helix domain-containing protein n=1 Tax=Clostridioides difficile TaxID=1496 RepID=UPI000F604DFA|nr:helix-turn-helix transcriptional regulator [Clostridioides difficile]RRH18923.1 XRE family transcriptional regulator [Clostridioides difficile]TOY69425.1 XRE family transcriptional regulator [Clostridioides difficile]HBE9554113.1 helix-turn-helix transcriptional regulator [Clostridioides difficile]HDX7061869.1 helix-turn-helix transcriptional regulator [Clostridioides difficile]HDX7205733.1 helix-turn-helix transcriptional regulator [Clostridioides difficile]